MARIRNSRGTTAISTTTRNILTAVGIMMTVAAGRAGAATLRKRLAKLMFVAVLEIVPPESLPMLGDGYRVAAAIVE